MNCYCLLIHCCRHLGTERGAFTFLFYKCRIPHISSYPINNLHAPEVLLRTQHSVHLSSVINRDGAQDPSLQLESPHLNAVWCFSTLIQVHQVSRAHRRGEGARGAWRGGGFGPAYAAEQGCRKIRISRLVR